MYVDYRAINQQTKLNKYPLARIADLLDQLINANCFSSIDLYTGYNNIAICPRYE